MARVIDQQEFVNEVLDGEGLVLVDFFATWCGPCKMLTPVLEQLSTELEGKATILSVDVDESQQLAMKYNVYSVPTMILFKNGEKVDQMVGFLPKPNIQNWIEKHL